MPTAILDFLNTYGLLGGSILAILGFMTEAIVPGRRFRRLERRYEDLLDLTLTLNEQAEMTTGASERIVHIRQRRPREETS